MPDAVTRAGGYAPTAFRLVLVRTTCTKRLTFRLPMRDPKAMRNIFLEAGDILRVEASD